MHRATRFLLEQFNRPLDRFVEHAILYAVIQWRNTDMLYEILREDDASDYTFVLILTSATDREAMVQGFAAGADANARVIAV